MDPNDIKVTTEMLVIGALIFAAIDAVYVPLLMWRVGSDLFKKIKWELALAAGLVWFGIWSWAIGNFWDTVYRYVFPAWAQTWVPLLAAVIAPIVTLGLWTLAVRLNWKPILTFCLLSGVLGALTHLWAVYRGIVEKPPMLQGASPVAALVIAFFEYIFYWCVILSLAVFMHWIRSGQKVITRSRP